MVFLHPLLYTLGRSAIATEATVREKHYRTLAGRGHSMIDAIRGALNVVSRQRRPGSIIPPGSINAQARIPNLNRTAPLERQPLDRPASRTGVHPGPLSRAQSRFEAIA